ncbi:rRNA maturation RNase YbeY [bacterium]|uniref:Endoribonuclease YbeY n=3 Tax=Candidatus Nealsoniibacteriota TaxID=1817911 RepID=A0A2M7EC01_9BACT|nr:rRNA maturation RNase YbeY [bacterium]PIV65273.1 MAG: rRNA maturation RNase YbeY [Candidatus Nealsonbacteria bacterium CG01_land_8_20_14_3_00_12]PIW35333.1 MAG: rRNA maturation RNase YbeY [Candidatus Nealsonbacteria bacterium CG15_BIG_FIL_POST_REV_8_21_14_020_37_12]PJA83354.1 MAG: rRNA maturation RNase YbeY [Candidatus Nealsonbacteria bacterium CG_4_9_14_3_um_filter_37_29]
MIEVNNLTTVSADEEFLKKVVEKVLESENKNKDLSIALVGQGRIRELNKKYRGKNRVTDVLAFGDKDGLGEIVICLREVKKNAKRFDSNFETELAKVLIHGILHLLGQDHEKNEIAAKKMEEKQNYYLGLCQKLILSLV